MKSLYWDGTGLVLICKRLEERTFTLMNQLMGESVELTMSEFSLLLEGADLSKRFVESPKKYKELSLSVQKLREERNARSSEIKGKPTEEQILIGQNLKQKL